MKKLYIFFPIFTFCFVNMSLAQPRRNYPDWIKLKDSESIPCFITKQDSEKVVIETPLGNVRTINKNNIEWLQETLMSKRTGFGHVKRRPSPSFNTFTGSEVESEKR